MADDLATRRAIHLVDTASELMRCRGSFVTGDLGWSDIFIVAAHRLADFWFREGQSSELDDREVYRFAALDVLGVLAAMKAGLDEAIDSVVTPARFNGAQAGDIARALAR